MTAAPVDHGYTTAEQELAAALEGTAPHLARELADELGPYRTVELARVVRRAVAVGIRRRTREDSADRLWQVQELLLAGLDHVDPDCVSPEVHGV